MTQKLLARVAWSKGGVRAFVREVNAHLAEGYVVRDVSVTPRWCRLLCLALLESPEAYEPVLNEAGDG